MRIHIICPFHRKELIPTLIEYLKPMNIEWHPVCDPVEIEWFNDINEAWIHPVPCPYLKLPGDQAFKKLNDFIDIGNIIDEDYYGFMGDDDMYEPNFFDVIRKQTAKVLMFSLSRGNAIPTYEGVTPHDTSPLIISSPENVFVCGIGLPQYIIKGEILKQIRFNNTQPHDDGIFAEELVKRFSNDIKFLPDLFAYGNYFEPERYTNDDWKIKSNWELPIIKESK